MDKVMIHLRYLDDLKVQPLHSGQLDVWLVSISKISHYHNLFEALLSDDEKLKANSYYQAKDRIRYTISRGLLRYVIANYLKISNQTICFSYGKYGKPFLENRCLEFNLSHSHNRIAMAFTKSGNVGIDIEYKQVITNEISLLLSSISSAVELDQFQQLSNQQKLDAFYYLWTIKEAYGKSTGKGLHSGLQDIEVPIIINHFTKSCETISNIVGMADCFVLGGFPLQNYTGALVSENVPEQLNLILLN
jgi:4'-phosphopantetheinyl transferase